MSRIEYLINNPYEVEEYDLDLLNTEINKYPYFYSLRALKLIALQKVNNPEFENQLEITSIFNNSANLFYLLNQNNIDTAIDLTAIEEIQNNDLIIEEAIDNQNIIDNPIDLTAVEEIQNNDLIIEETIDNQNIIDTPIDLTAIEEIQNNNLIIEETIDNQNNIDTPIDLTVVEEIQNNDLIIEEAIDNQNIIDNPIDLTAVEEIKISELINHSVQVTNDFLQTDEIISKAVKETQEVLLTSEILDIEQVELVNRTTQEIDVITNYNMPVLRLTPFYVLNQNNQIARETTLKQNVEQLIIPEKNEIIIAETSTPIADNLVNEERNIKEDLSVINENKSFSFNEWLKIPSSNLMTTQQEKEQKFQIIEDFLEKNPKITPVKKQEIPEYKNEIKNIKQTDFSDLMTETLAQIYIEQKQYEKAIKAYKILILKYPEKNSLFAKQIKEIENLKNSK